MEVRDKNKKQSRNGSISVLPSSSTTRKPKSCYNNKKPSPLNSTKKPFPLPQPQSQSGKKPTSKPSQRSKLSAASNGSWRNPACGSERGEPSDLNFSVPDSLVGFENFTPVGKLLPWSNLNNVDFNLSSISANVTDESKATTPPVEVSVSPEIQGGGGLYADVAISSTVTPVCYGAGHLISGVTDKRKCRSRGILTVRGPSDSLGFSDDDVVLKSRNSLIPLPAEASLDWLLSPLGKEGEVQTCDSSDSESRPLGGLSPIPSPSLSSSLCRISSDFLSDNHGNSDALTSTGKTRVVPLSPRRVSICEEILESLSEEKAMNLSAIPESKSTVCLAEKGSRSYNLLGDKSPASTGPLSCSNVVQTPSSNTSSESRGCYSWIDVHEDQKFSPDRVIVEPDFQMSMWDPLVLGPQSDHSASPSHLTDVIKLEKQTNGCASWVSDSTLASISLSQMRISWREGSSETFNMDDFDCCICLSDEEDSGERLGGFQHDSLEDFIKDNADPLKTEGLRSPEFLEKEPKYFRKEKKISSPPNISAESIITDASGLVASRDSDWTPYDGNQSFQVGFSLKIKKKNSTLKCYSSKQSISGGPN